MRRARRMLQDLDQEIREHIEMETLDNIGRGMSPEDARRAALRNFVQDVVDDRLPIVVVPTVGGLGSMREPSTNHSQ